MNELNEILFGERDDFDAQYIYGAYTVSKKTCVLSNGNAVVFETNACEIELDCEIEQELFGNYPHVGISARKGISICYQPIYTNGNCGEWSNLDCFVSKDKSLKIKINMDMFIGKNRNIKSYYMIIYFPILSKIVFHSLKANNATWIKPMLNINRINPLIMVGSITSYGIGITSPSYVFSNILFRHLKREVYNISRITTLNEYDKNTLAYLKSKMPGVVVYEWDNSLNEKKHIENIYCLQKQLEPKKIIVWINPLKSSKTICMEILAELRENVNIHLIKTNDILKNSQHLEYITYSAKFLNDYGQVLIAKAIEEIINSK